VANGEPAVQRRQHDDHLREVHLVRYPGDGRIRHPRVDDEHSRAEQAGGARTGDERHEDGEQRGGRTEHDQAHDVMCARIQAKRREANCVKADG